MAGLAGPETRPNEQPPLIDVKVLAPGCVLVAHDNRISPTGALQFVTKPSESVANKGASAGLPAAHCNLGKRIGEEHCFLGRQPSVPPKVFVDVISGVATGEDTV